MMGLTEEFTTGQEERFRNGPGRYISGGLLHMVDHEAEVKGAAALRAWCLANWCQRGAGVQKTGNCPKALIGQSQIV